MHVRYTTVTRGDKQYRYPQLVVKFKDGNGRSRKKIVASLKDLPAIAVENMRVALAAASADKPLLLQAPAVEAMEQVEVLASLRYLDVAVAMATWRRWSLGQLIDELAGSAPTDVPVSEVIAALVVHRCVDPDFKVRTARWYPNTALPEIQGLMPRKINNSRIHRALAVLDRIEDELQERLAEKISARTGAFVALFADISDATFHGAGPDMARVSLTKRGTMQQKVGIALLCEQRGFPLRWRTLEGRSAEGPVMSQLVESVARLDWARNVPVVMDRAMGKGVWVEWMIDQDLPVVTALPVNEFDSYAHRIPWRAFADLSAAGTDFATEADVELAAVAARAAGLHEIRGDRFILDLGEVGKSGVSAVGQNARNAPGHAAQLLERGLAMRIELDSGAVGTRQELADAHGLSLRGLRRYLKITRLTPDARALVLGAEAQSLTLKDLLDVASQPAPRQIERITAHVERVGTRRATGRPPAVATKPKPERKVRMVVMFNPAMFVEQHKTALSRLTKLEAFLDDLRRRLKRSSSRRSEKSVHAEIERWLRKDSMVSLFDICIERDDDGCWRVDLIRHEEAWAKRLRYFGVSVFVANPRVEATAEEIVELYFAKDQVEKDFQLIKGELDLMPIKHRTDGKVRAHVSLCALALLLERSIEHTAAEAGHPVTAASILDELEPARLNHLSLSGTTGYRLTNITQAQEKILTALDLQRLSDPDELRRTIRPR